MLNYSHLKVLLKKDFLTLWRSKGFIFLFLAIPFLLMAVFLFLVSIVDQGQKDGKLINDYFRYTSTVQFPDSSHFFDLPAYDS